MIENPAQAHLTLQQLLVYIAGMTADQRMEWYKRCLAERAASQTNLTRTYWDCMIHLVR